MNAKKRIAWTLCALLVALFCYRTVHQKKKEESAYLKRETLFHLLDEEKFIAKLKETPPQWMQEQVADDFAAFSTISTQAVDATLSQIEKQYSNRLIVRYRIVDNQLYRYFPKGQIIGTVNCGTEKAIKTLLRIFPFTDMDFILSYEDGIPVPGIPENLHVTEDRNLQAPVLFSAKVKDVPYIVLIPDWRSIYQWWASDIQDVLAAMKNQPWDKKKDKAIWRGALTKAIRLPFCRLSKGHSDILNAKINVQEADRAKQDQIEDEGLFGGRVSWDEFLAHKYLPILDGGCCAAPAFQWRLLSNSLTLKQESNEIQWFYRALKPYEHYVPMENDLSDFVEIVQWAKEHDGLCKQISENATEFVLNHLMMEDVCVYFYHVLKAYSFRQKLDRKQLQTDMQHDARWVNIHNMHALDKRVKKHKLKGYKHSVNNP